MVVGVLSTDKGPVLCDEAAEVGEAWGRKLRPLLSSLGVTGRAGESVKVPTAGVVKTPLLVLVGLGPAGEGRLRHPHRRTPRRRRRRPQRPQRRVRRPGPPGRLPRAGRGRHRGPPARRLHLHPAQVRRHRGHRPRRGRRAEPGRPQGRGGHRLRGGAGRLPRGDHLPRLGQRAARPPHPARLRRRRHRGPPRAHQGPRRPQGHPRGARRAAARRARLRRHARGRQQLGRQAADGPPDLVAPRARDATSRSSARASPSTRAASPSSPPAACSA